MRGQTHADYAWLPALGQLYQRNGLTLALALVAGLTLFLLAAALQGRLVLWGPGPGQLYGIFPHNLLVGLFAPVFLFVVLALAVGVQPLLARCDARHQRRADE